MAEAQKTSPGLRKLQHFQIVNANVSAGADKAKPKTKDGLDHSCGAVVVQLGAATDGASLAKSITDYFADVNAVENDPSFAIVTKAGESEKKARNAFADGENRFVRGLKITPENVAGIVDLVNEALRARHRAKQGAYLNKFRVGYGGDAEETTDEIDPNAIA